MQITFTYITKLKYLNVKLQVHVHVRLQSSFINSLMLFTCTTERGKLFQSLIILTNSEYL